MPVQKLDLYDIIVDIFPGLVAVFIFLPLVLGPGTAYSDALDLLGIEATLIIIVLSYVIGRIVHGIASPFDKSISKFGSNIDKFFLEHPIYEKLTKRFGLHLSFEDHIRDGLAPFTPFTMKTVMVHELHAEINEKYDVNTKSIDRHDFNDLKHVCHSILYNKPVLYRRYEILTTFFRSMHTVFGLSLIFYSISLLVYEYVGLGATDTFWAYLYFNDLRIVSLILVLQLILFLIFYYQKRKFSHRRNRALIYDTVIELKGKTE
ncbi:hypothetical protein [Natronorubrum tibetense]|uniref:Uncharacterized protein n=1 Tax=Natronorubrum tibetense GA33 TaxID=1114856 RepID=L9VPM0_9EURY|nr:hypothetical protein [Natronorubrum tibetense]ELY39155.1 hypothetical protein C496_14897 [Natronorubrum tibetense GA33]